MAIGIIVAGIAIGIAILGIVLALCARAPQARRAAATDSGSYAYTGGGDPGCEPSADAGCDSGGGDGGGGGGD